VTGTATAWVVFINALGVLLVFVVGVFAFRRLYSKAISEAQDRVIAIQKGEIEALTSQVATLTRDYDKLRGTLATVRYVLKKQGTDIIIEDEYVTLKTTATPKSTTVRMKRTIIEKQVERNDRLSDEAADNFAAS